MCGILGLLLHDPKGEACTDLFEGLGYLQHRGQVVSILSKLNVEGRLWHSNMWSKRTLLPVQRKWNGS